ncbi:putative malic acid transport protein [Triangularia setosa]|uniref:Malic acid transport protein n=1 Tax=Triangularia setosa TaxID=2587417 RepID=A0AAN7A1C2_9PEZI|nr:putative malic acid transport protein [Podospora setosa]
MPSPAHTLVTPSPAQKAIQNFTSQWFLVPQGTGITAVIIHQLDYQFPGLDIISFIFFLLTILFLLTTTALYLTRCDKGSPRWMTCDTRCMLHPQTALSSLRQTQEEIACLTSISITYSSMIQMISLTLPHLLWWTNVVLAAVSIVGVPFVILWIYPSRISRLSPASQLPMPMIATLTVAAGGGTISQNAGLTPEQQVPVVVVSYLFLGCGLPLAFARNVLFWARLLDRSQPDRQHTLQDMILCGPWGGIFTEEAARPVGCPSMFVGMLLWGMGTFWWGWVVVGILHTAVPKMKRQKHLPFGHITNTTLYLHGASRNPSASTSKTLTSGSGQLFCSAVRPVFVRPVASQRGNSSSGSSAGGW